MELVRVTGIQALNPGRARESVGDVKPAFAVEGSDRMEDEEPSSRCEDSEVASEKALPVADGNVNLFA